MLASLPVRSPARIVWAVLAIGGLAAVLAVNLVQDDRDREASIVADLERAPVGLFAPAARDRVAISSPLYNPHAFGIRSPSSPVRNSFKRHKVERNYNKWIRRTGVPLICGHTHRERFPTGDDLPYFNTGSCVFPSYITGLELVDGALSLVGWRVEPDDEGFLRVRRSTLQGPRPVESLYR